MRLKVMGKGHCNDRTTIWKNRQWLAVLMILKKAHGKRTEGRLKIQVIKLQGGVLAPLDELESEELKSLKNGRAV